MPLHNLCKLDINRTVTAHSDIFLPGGASLGYLTNVCMNGTQESRFWGNKFYMSRNGWQSRRLVTLDSENRV